MGELRLRARARPDAQIAQDADLELLGQVGLGEGWSRLSPLIAHARTKAAVRGGEEQTSNGGDEERHSAVHEA